MLAMRYSAPRLRTLVRFLGMFKQLLVSARSVSLCVGVGLLVTACGGGGSSSVERSANESGAGADNSITTVKLAADAGRDVVTPNVSIVLNAAKSVASNGSPIQYSWALTSPENNKSVVIDDADTVSPTLRMTDEGVYKVLLTVSDSSGNKATDEVVIRREMPQTNNAAKLSRVRFVGNQYQAYLTSNANNITTHFKRDQGRLDYWRVTFPFEIVVRNIGIAPLNNPDGVHKFAGNEAYNFAGVQVHSLNLNEPNSSHIVVGHRGEAARFTVEGKNTVDGHSDVTDVGSNVAPTGRADIRIVGDKSGEVIAYWQLPRRNLKMGTDRWIPYGGGDNLPGDTPNYGRQGDAVYVGLITYAFMNQGVPFMGVADSVEIYTAR